MGRIYSAVRESIVVSTPIDMFELNVPADAACIVHKMRFSQSSDAGDAESEGLNVLIHRGSTSGSGGSSITPSPHSPGDAAFGGTVESGNTSLSTEGAFIDAPCFNVMAGWVDVIPPELKIEVSPNGRIVFKLQSTPGDALTMNLVLIFEEIGG